MEIKKRLAKLIDLKSIMTLLMTIVFCVMALCGVISGQEFLTIFVVIVGFYFGTQSQKKADQLTVDNGQLTIKESPAAMDLEASSTASGPPSPEGKVMAVQNDVHPPDVVVEGFAG